MAEKRRGLGRGLGALIPSAPPQAPSRPSTAAGKRPSDMFFSSPDEESQTNDATTAEIEEADGKAIDEAVSVGKANRFDAQAESSSVKSARDVAEEMAKAAAAKRDSSRKRRPSSSQNSKSDAVEAAPTRSAAKSTSKKASTEKPESAKSVSPDSKTDAKAKTSKATPQKRTSSKSGSSVAKSAESIPAGSKPGAESKQPKSREASTPRDVESYSPVLAPSDIPHTDTAPKPDPGRPAPLPESSTLRDSPNLPVDDLDKDGAESKERDNGWQPAARQNPLGSENPAETPVPYDEEPVWSGKGAESGSTGGEESSAMADEGPFSNLIPVPGAQFADVPVGEIRRNPRNPRTVFEEDALDELAFSLKEIGVLQPIVVRPIPDEDAVDNVRYELIMGERRWRASERAGLETIPAIVRETDDNDLLRDALLENLHRAQLNPLEEAAAYNQLLSDFGCTQDELADRIGRSRPQISNTMRLLRLPPLVQRRVANGVLSAGHARALLSVEDHDTMETIAQQVVSQGLSVRATEQLVAKGGGSFQQRRRSATRSNSYNPTVTNMASKLSDRFETNVRIDVGKRKGKMIVEFSNIDDLQRIIDEMGLQAEEDSSK